MAGGVALFQLAGARSALHGTDIGLPVLDAAASMIGLAVSAVATMIARWRETTGR